MGVRNDRVTEYRVHGWNPFYDGWLAYVLGFPRRCPHEKNSEIATEGWYLGWDTAQQTTSLNTTRYVFVKESDVGHDHIRTQREERTPLPPRTQAQTGEATK